MRRIREICKLLTVVLCALSLGGAPAIAGHRAKKPKGGAAAAAGPQVTAKIKTVLRATPEATAKAVGKIRPKEKLSFVARSPDGQWAQVRKGKVAGWIGVENVDGLPAVDTTAALPAVPKEGDPPPKTPEPATPATTTATNPPPAEPVRPAPVTVESHPEVTPPVAPVSPPVVVAVATPVPAPPPERSEVKVPPPPKTPFAGLWFTVGGGFALLNSSFSSTFKSGLNPEFFNYDVTNLPAFGIQARLGYTFGYKWLRVGVDGAYYFAGGTSIVVRLAEKDSLPLPQKQPDGSIAMVSTVLPAQRQVLSLTSHDAEGSVSIGGYFRLGNKLEMSVRARGGIQVQAFLPEFNPHAVLPKELLFGPHVGGLVEFQSRFLPGFGVRFQGSYIPYAQRQENDGAKDVVPTATSTANGFESSTGYNLGASVSMRVVSGFDVELGYRLLATQTTYSSDSGDIFSQRLKFDRDPVIQARAEKELLTNSVNAMGATVPAATRSTSQQLIFIGIAFRR